MSQNKPILTFTVRRHAPELIVPAKPTPRELKPLSDIDDQEGLRFHIPVIHFYRHNPKTRNKNPASVIREALAKVLVFYYPFAGRLKEGPARKLMVDCTGDGVLFIEAEADVTLEQFGDALQPPFPCMEELLYDVPGSKGILDSPLMLIQVTHLLCGGFIFALRLNHTMSDASGLVQFLIALVIKRRPHFTTVHSYIVSDVTRAGFNKVDFGWGKPSKGGVGDFPYVASFYIPFVNYKGESGIVVPICLPSVAMKNFVEELSKMLVRDNNEQVLQEDALLPHSKL